MNNYIRMWQTMNNTSLFRSKQFVIILTILLLLSACSPSTQVKEKANPLNPEQPISVTLWHYYSGHAKTKFDQLVNDFNNTTGIEKGIVVDAQSHGEIQQLETAVFDAANQKLGAQRLPDIFATYADNAFRVSQLVDLIDFETYFSKDELQDFQQDFLADGRLGADQQLQILPIVKSTENLFINKTLWDEFSIATNISIQQLATWEGIIEAAEAYYAWSGGKALLGIDSPSNFILMSALQLGDEIIQTDGSTVALNFEQDIAKKIWDSYYIPFINGYFAKEGRFSSDDAKVGLVVAYIGSTTSSVYFPTEVTLNQSDIREIENVTLPYPIYEGGQPFATQQGAGMAIVKSDTAHEYAAAEFLKWFTNIEQNSAFAVSTANFPVKNEALQSEHLLSVLDSENMEATPTLSASIKTTINMFDSYTLAGYKAFAGSFDVRHILNNHLLTLVQQDLKTLSEATSDEARAQLQAQFTSDEHFTNWYESFLTEIQPYFK